MRGSGAAAVVVAALVSACAQQLSVRPPAAGDAVIHVLDLGWHTDLAVPAADAPVTVTQGARSVVIGFGARTWYMAAVPGSWDGVQAVLGGPGVVLVRPLFAEAAALFGSERVATLHVSPEAMGALRAFLRRTVLPARLADGPHPGSTFYDTELRYGLAYTCNTWTVDALRAAGLPVNTWGVVTSDQAMREARRVEAAQAAVTRPTPPGQARDRSSEASPARPATPHAGAGPAPGPA